MKRMVSMKRKPEPESEAVKVAAIESGDTYPWGLRLNLDGQELKKLGIRKLPEVGDTFYLQAEARVVSVHESESQHEEGEKSEHRSMELQIRELALDREPQSAADAIDAGIREANS